MLPIIVLPTSPSLQCQIEFILKITKNLHKNTYPQTESLLCRSQQDKSGGTNDGPTIKGSTMKPFFTQASFKCLTCCKPSGQKATTAPPLPVNLHDAPTLRAVSTISMFIFPRVASPNMHLLTGNDSIFKAERQLSKCREQVKASDAKTIYVHFAVQFTVEEITA